MTPEEIAREHRKTVDTVVHAILDEPLRYTATEAYLAQEVRALAASEQRVRELERVARILLAEFKGDVTGEYSSPASREFERLLASPGSPQEKGE